MRGGHGANAPLPTLRILRELLRRLQDRDVIRDRGAAHVEDAAERGVLELHALGRLARKLHRRHHMHGDAGRTDRVTLGLQPAGRINRQLAVLLGPALLDGARALPLRRQAHRFVLDQLGDGEAVMGFDKAEIGERNARLLQRALPGHRAALELQDVALAHRQEILRMRGGADVDRLAHGLRGLGIGQHQRGGAIGDERAVGALQGTGDVGILLALGSAEVEAEVLAHLRIGVGDAVLVILGRDHRQRIGLVAIFLEIALRDLAEHAGEAADGVAVFRQIGCLQKILADLCARGARHLLDADDKHDPCRAGGDGADALVHGGRTRGAGVLDAGRGLEAQMRVGLQHQRRRKVLRRETGVEMAEHDLVDIAGGNAGIRQRLVGDLDHEAFHGLGVEFSEGRMRPSNDAGSHGGSPLIRSDVRSSPSGTGLHAAFADLTDRSHMAVMPDQLPDLMSTAWHSQEPPTATTLGSASHMGALVSPIPPVGQNRTCGNGPASARRALIPPACSAGKNFIVVKPCSSACISSEAVAIPGANGSLLAAAAFSSSGVAPGLMPNLAPSSSARARSSALRMVPMPTMASGTLAIIAFAASIATGVRKVTSSMRTPPDTSARASGTASSSLLMVSTGTTRAALNSAVSFSCFETLMTKPCWSLPAWQTAE